MCILKIKILEKAIWHRITCNQRNNSGHKELKLLVTKAANAIWRGYASSTKADTLYVTETFFYSSEEYTKRGTISLDSRSHSQIDKNFLPLKTLRIIP